MIISFREWLGVAWRGLIRVPWHAKVEYNCLAYPRCGCCSESGSVKNRMRCALRNKSSDQLREMALWPMGIVSPRVWDPVARRTDHIRRNVLSQLREDLKDDE